MVEPCAHLPLLKKMQVLRTHFLSFKHVELPLKDLVCNQESFDKFERKNVKDKAVIYILIKVLEFELKSFSLKNFIKFKNHQP